MSWRNRKLFGNLPQGIISGLEPIPRYQMGGMVRGYEAGGSFPNKGLAALNKVAPDVVEKMGYEGGGFINPQNYVNGGTVGMPIGMEAGALVPKENFMERGINNMLESLGIETDVNKVRQNKRDNAERKIRADIEANNFVKNLMAEYMDGTKTGGDFIKEYGNVKDLKLRYIEKKYPDVYEDFYSMPFEARSKLNRATETFDQAIGMEAGALVPEVFESGDQQINEALNTMVATTMPTGDATTMPIGDATTTIPMEDPVGGVEMVAEDTTGDSSSKEALFMTQVNEQKNILQQTIERLITEKSQENLDPMNLKTQIGDFIVKADSLFKRKVTDIANKLNVEVLPEQVTLLTDDFAEKLEVMFPSITALEPDEEDMQVASMDQGLEIPGMEHGGLHIADKGKEVMKNLSKNITSFLPFSNSSRSLMLEHKKNQLINSYGSYEKMPENIKKRHDALVQEQIALSGKVVSKQEDAAEAARKKEIERLTDIITSRFAADKSKEDAQKKLDDLTETKETVLTTTSDTATSDTSATTTEPELKDLLGQSAEDIRKAALMTGKSKQGGVLGFMDVVGQSNLAAAKADREALLKRYEVDAITTARMDEANENAFNSFLRDESEEDVLESYILSGRTLPKSRQAVIPAGKVNGADFAQYLKIYRTKDKNTPLQSILAEFASKAA